MLKNILKPDINEDSGVDANDIKVTYNQKPIIVEPGKNLDVRDFGVPNEEIIGVERHILLKNPNVFSQSSTKDVHKTNQAALKKIDDLEAKLVESKTEFDAQKKSADESRDKLKKVQAENEGLTKNVHSLQASVKDLQANLKAVK